MTSSSRAPGTGVCVYRARCSGVPVRALRADLFALGFFVGGI